MSVGRAVLLRASRSQWLAEQLVRREFARRAVKKFMPGEEPGDALEAAARLAAENLGAVLTQLGENITSPQEALAVRDHYLGVLDQIVQRGLKDTIVSVKPTQLGLDLSFDACLGHLDTLAAKVRQAQAGVLWIDMEDSSYVDRTLDLYRRLKEKHDNVGVCLQSYLRRTPADVDALLPIRPAIRLVKGAYAEAPHVAFPDKRDVDVAYYAIADALLGAAARGAAFPVFGTHDRALIDRITARAAALSVPDGGFEIHMLFGIRTSDQRALARAGRKVRTLISYGRSWFPWYMRRLAERPANVWFVMRSLLP